MNMTELSDLKLTLDEWHTLTAISAGPHHRSPHRAAHVDMLILAGLMERGNEVIGLTEAGIEAAAAIDMIFDWDEFAFKGAESPSEPVAELIKAEAPKRIGVGSLVLHKHHGAGLVIDHFMWDGDWGGFRIQLLKPSETGASTSISEISDRADAFELVS